MAKTYQHIYLSPHYDDAALSAGGTIHRQTQAGEPVLIVTVCAASPRANTSFSPFAQEMHVTWGDPIDVVALRRAEDEAAMEILGADYVRLDFTDCIYRGHSLNGPWFYNNNEQLFGEIHPDDKGLVSQIVEALENQVGRGKNPTIYAPLTVGHHVDHQLVHTAAWQLNAHGWSVMFYEDYPYVDTEAYGDATLDETLAWLKHQQRPVQARLQFFSEADLRAKVASINAYASQLDVLFGSQIRATESVQKYALQVGDGQPAECFWIPE